MEHQNEDINLHDMTCEQLYKREAKLLTAHSLAVFANRIAQLSQQDLSHVRSFSVSRLSDKRIQSDIAPYIADGLRTVQILHRMCASLGLLDVPSNVREANESNWIQRMTHGAELSDELKQLFQEVQHTVDTELTRVRLVAATDEYSSSPSSSSEQDETDSGSSSEGSS